METVKQTTDEISYKEETAVTKLDTFPPGAFSEVESEAVPRTKTTRRHVVETNEAEGLVEESPEKETSETNSEGGTTGGETKQEAPSSEECHGTHPTAPEDCMRDVLSEESSHFFIQLT